MLKIPFWNMLFLLFLLLLAEPFPAEETGSESFLLNDKYDIDDYEDWVSLDTSLKELTSSAIKQVYPIILDYMSEVNLSSACRKDVLYLFAGIKGLKEWAVKLIDSSGKTIDGMLEGAFSSLGNYRECINVVATKFVSKIGEKIVFEGQYCSVRARLKVPEKRKGLKLEKGMKQLNFTKSLTDMTKMLRERADILRQPNAALKLGLCVPTGCTLDDINQLVQLVGSKLSVEAKVDRCERKNKETNFSISFIVAMSFYGTAALLVFAGTLLDLYSQTFEVKFKSLGSKVLIAFSFMRNFKMLINTKLSSETLSCIHGLRFLSMAWIVIAHCFIFTLNTFVVITNLNNALSRLSWWDMQILLNGFLAVDTFFFISGFLNAYIRIKEMNEKQKPRSFIFSIIHRLWRIFPAYIFCMLFLFLFENAVSGPNSYDTYVIMKDYCKKHWWKNFLFINNFLIDATGMCLPETWYLACDFQLFIVALFSIHLFWKWPKTGIAVNGVLVLSSVIYMGVYTKVYNSNPTFIIHGATEKSMLDAFRIYSKPFMHAQSYFIGVLTGYFLLKNKDMKIPKKILYIGWVLSICLACSSLFATQKWNAGNEPSELESIFYASLSKIAYSLALSWVLTCCMTGHGGIVNTILSYSAWVSLSRLSYITYLISPLIQMLYLAHSKTTIDFDILFTVWRSFGDLFFSLCAATAICLLIEAPFVSLEKIFLVEKAEKNKKMTKSAYINAVYEYGDIKTPNSTTAT